MANGVLAGYPLQGVKATLYDGSYHDVDSSEVAFKVAGSMALKAGALDASPVLLEPVMKVEVVTPDEFRGAIQGDLNGRRGQITGIEVRGNAQVVSAEVPLSEMFGYATDLRSMTQGKAEFTMEFSRYLQVPDAVATDLMEKKAEQDKAAAGKK